jgi:hypothetical protein
MRRYSSYQLIVLGNDNKFHNLVMETLHARLEELGLLRDMLEIIDSNGFADNYRANSPVVAIYYGGILHDDLAIIDRLKIDASLILPVCQNLSTFAQEIPENLRSINGVKLESEVDIDSFVNNILEGFSLLRLSRRLFISYKRNESRAAAIQLFEKLEEAGFDVFLDTHSIRKGDSFQEELWHRLVDTDVVVLLNTPGFLTSQWTTEELAKANSMSIGILQLIWPENTAERSAELSIPIYLKDDDFVPRSFNETTGVLTEHAVISVVQQVERLRARSLAARQDNIITEFIKSAASHAKNATLQREKYVTIVARSGKVFVIIPTIGVPHAFSYHQSEELIKMIKSQDVEKIFLLYDHRNIREKWQQHLSWLDEYLPVGSIKITEIDDWLNKI